MKERTLTWYFWPKPYPPPQELKVTILINAKCINACYGNKFLFKHTRPVLNFRLRQHWRNTAQRRDFGTCACYNEICDSLYLSSQTAQIHTPSTRHTTHYSMPAEISPLDDGGGAPFLSTVLFTSSHLNPVTTNIKRLLLAKAVTWLPPTFVRTGWLDDWREYRRRRMVDPYILLSRSHNCHRRKPNYTRLRERMNTDSPSPVCVLSVPTAIIVCIM
jgi:hypothetical protein